MSIIEIFFKSGVTPAATNSPSTRSQPEVVLSTRGKRRAGSIESDAYSPSGSDDEILIQPLPTETRSTHAKDAQCPSPSRQAGPSSSSGSAAKRPRLDNPTLDREPVPAFLSTSDNQKTHHSKFFFPDSNVVLEVDNVLFKVYWYPLAQKSPYFTIKFQDLAKPAGISLENIEGNGDFDPNDKISISTTDVKVNMISGCPAYKLDQVSAEEFAELLRLVYDRINYTPMSQSLLAIFRSSKRLEFSEYEAFAVRELDKLWSRDRVTQPPDSSMMSPEDALAIMKLVPRGRPHQGGDTEASCSAEEAQEGMGVHCDSSSSPILPQQGM
ncbi:hypothetical protein K474DRAFT_865385 [Panus rudis PR-1116 ss-1]|nr:hypothetical protein K474DRAFT_865385 [Panus rudis PR-1116 ss-1]